MTTSRAAAFWIAGGAGALAFAGLAWLAGAAGAASPIADPSGTTGCGPSAPSAGAAPAGSRQLLTVVAPRATATSATVSLWQRRGTCFVRAGGPWPARTGRSGLSRHHHEGDGTTPLGTFGIGPVAYGALANPGTRLTYHRLVCGDWWDEDPTSAAYNRFVHLACGAKPAFGGGSEALWRTLPAYDYFAVIDYNTAPVRTGAGSAIFLHLSTGSATNGCVSLPAAALKATLRWLDPAAHPVVAIGLAVG